MSESHKVKCDKCGIVKPMLCDRYFNILPKGWAHSIDKQDLCTKCFKLFTKHKEAFFK